jgi:hypothetical protein
MKLIHNMLIVLQIPKQKVVPNDHELKVEKSYHIPWIRVDFKGEIVFTESTHSCSIIVWRKKKI